MLYAGQFSFDVLSHVPSMSDFDRGFFTALVEAETLEEATEKFRELIRSVDDSEAFEGVGDIYLDVGIEVRQLPEEGVVTYIEFHEAGGGSSLSTALPEAPAGSVAAFDWGPAERSDDEEDYERVPFMSIRH